MNRTSSAGSSKLHYYSAHGWHERCNGPLVYHQGGLDTYCGFYATLNLINFLKFKERPANPDFIGTADFKRFKELVSESAFETFFPMTPFGDEGSEPPMLVGLLSLVLSHFKVNGKCVLEDDLSIDPNDESRWDRWFRYGAENPFVPPSVPDSTLGLAAVIEDACDKLQHWVVFIGKDHLHGTEIECEAEWNGIVLDSARGYERWKVGPDVETNLPRITVRRGESEKSAPVEWISSFVSVFLGRQLDRPR